jgi:hypothetical protein
MLTIWTTITQDLYAAAIAFLVACVLVLLVSVLLLVSNSIRLQRKNDALVELLLADTDRHTKLLLDESNRHTSSVLALSERLSFQYYMHQEKVSIEHIATLRELLSSLRELCSPANQTNPDSPEDRKTG